MHIPTRFVFSSLVMQTLIDFSGSADFMPHGYCLRWSSILLWLHVGSDLLITLSYYAIPVCLTYFVYEQRNLPYRWLIHLSALFIVACGTTHLISALTIWLPLYWLEAYVKVFTALISVVTVILMWRVIPIALRLPTAQQLLSEITQKQFAQDAQQELLERLEKIASRLPGVVYQFRLNADGSSCFPYASPAIQDIYRVTPDEVRDTAEKVFAILHPDDYQSIVDSILLSAKQLTPWQLEYRVLFADDVERWLSGNALPQRELDGSVLWHGFITDITESKQKDIEYQMIIEASFGGFWSNDTQGQFLEVNNGLCEMLGYSKEELLTLQISDIDAQEQPYETQRHIEQVMTTGHDHFETQHRRKDGTIIDVEINVQHVPVLGNRCFVFVNDISQTKQLQRAERQQYALLLNVINSLSYPFYVVSTDDYSIQLANKSAGEWLKNKTTCYQLSQQQNVPCNLLNGHPCPVQDVKRTKQAVVLQHIHKDKSGGMRTIDIFAYPIFDEQGEVHQLIEYVIDVTERVKNEQALKQSSHDLNQRINELRCLYAISELVKNDGLNQEQMIARCLELLVEAYRYPEITAFRISLFEQYYQTANFRPAPWRQEALIKVQGKIVGRIEICYLQKRLDDAEGVLLAERELLDTVARVLGETFERKQIQRDILDTKNQLQATLNAIPDLLLEVDSEGRFCDYHAPRDELMLTPTENFLGKTINEVLSQEAAAVFFAALHEAQQRGYSTGKEIQLKLKHGVCWFELSVAYKCIEQEKIRFIILSRDVTVRKQTEMALRDSQQRLRESKNFFQLLAQINPVGIYQTDAQGQCIFVNPKWCEIAGIDAEQALGNGWREVIMLADRESVYREWDSSIREQRLFRLEYRFQKADGTITWVYGLSAVIHDERGDISGYVGTIIDISERKVMEDILKAQQAFTVSILNSLTSHIAVLNAQGEIVMVNRAWQAFGEKNGSRSCLGDNYLSVCHDAFQLEPKQEIVNVFQGINDVLACVKPDYHTEYPCNTRTESLWFYMTVSPLQGDKAGVVISHENITPRVLMEQELRNSEAKLRRIIEVSRVPMALNDEKGNITYLNPAFIQTFGYDLSDIPTLTDWWPKAYPDPAYREWVSHEWYAALEKAKRENTAMPPLELMITCKNNGVKTVLITAAAMSVGFAGEHLIQLYDITERKQAEQIKRDNEKQLRAFYDLDLVGFAVTSPEKGWVRTNNCLCQMLGYAAETLYQMTWAELTHPDDLAADIEQFNRLLAGEINGYALEKRFISRSGKSIPTKLVVRSVRKDNGELDYVMAMIEDISDYKQAEAELLRSNAELDQFAYAVSHDMRQPLRMVSSYLGLIEQALSTQLTDESRQFLHFAIEGAKRMDAMILSLLDYSRVGRHTSLLAWVLSRAALDEALAFLRPALQASGGTINVSGDWRDLYANHDELSRLLQNLIGNALKNHEKNSPPRVDVEANTVNNRFLVTVRDFGIGIDANQTDRLFKVFSRLQSRQDFEGTGVGLALCRKIVEHHGGKIGVQSAGLGQGSVFWFELPLITASKTDALDTRH